MSEDQNSFFASRRGFLQSTVGAGIGLATWPLAARGDDELLQQSASDPTIAAPAPPGCARWAGLNGRPPDSTVVAAIERSLHCIIVGQLESNFPRTYEIERLTHDAVLRQEVVTRCLDWMMEPAARRQHLGPVHTMIFPKPSMSGYRRCVSLEVTVATFYLVCAVLMGAQIEAARSPLGARRVFSFRYWPDGDSIFERRFDYAAFRGETEAKLDSRDRKVLVCADIASFYPSIDTDRLLVSLEEIGAAPWLCGALGELLSQWRNRLGGGLPIGPVASALLAEATLIKVDRGLEEDGVDYIRYVDDYRLFAQDAPSARHATERLIERLAQDGLQLNEAKTSTEFVTRQEYIDRANARRSARYWGGLQNTAAVRWRLAEDDQAPKGQSGQKKDGKKGSGDKKESPKPETPPIVPGGYGKSPFQKTELNEFDVALLSNVDPVVFLTDKLAEARSGEPVKLGTVRVFVEAACLRSEYESIGRIFDVLDESDQAIAYVVNVLIAERRHMPIGVRSLAGDWFASRLTAGRCASDYEALQVATLLGTEGYRRPDAVFGYLRAADWRELSPIVVGALLAAVQGDCDAQHAADLAERAAPCDVLVRRAAFNVAWPHLDSAQRASLARTYSTEFASDPFLRRLAKTESVAL